MIPNAVTALALCFGLTGVSFAIARRVGKGARLRSSSPASSTAWTGASRGCCARRASSAPSSTSLSDNIAFGTAPALILFLWSLQTAPQVRLDRRAGARGLLRASSRAIQRADRRRRAAAQIGRLQYRRAGAGGRGAGLRSDLSVAGHRQRAGSATWYVVMPWTLFIALLMISSIADLQLVEHSHPPRAGGCSRLPGSRLLGRRAADRAVDTLLAVAALYLVMIPFSLASYARVRRRRATRGCARIGRSRRAAAARIGATPNARLTRGLALEGSGDLRAAFLKNRGARRPPAATRWRGRRGCPELQSSHRPSWQRLTAPDRFVPADPALG